MLTRRNFVHAMSGVAAAPLFLKSMAAEAAGSDPGTIVVAIMLQGGNDGLNTVIPLSQYGTYNAYRTPAAPPPGLALAYTEAQLAPLAFDPNWMTAAGGATQFAFAPSMSAMRDLYATGHLAVVAGVGVPEAEMFPTSHVNGFNDWMTGQINLDGAAASPPGWLGATFDGKAFGPIGPTVSAAGFQQIIQGRTHPGMVVGKLSSFSIGLPDLSYNQRLVPYLGSDATGRAPTPAQAAFKSSMNAMLAQVQSIQAIAKAKPLTDYPQQQSGLDAQLFTIAQMILGNSGARGYCALQGTYDTHQSQNGDNYHPMMLSQLTYSMSSFYTYLKANGASSNVVIMTLSDFGRTPKANSSFGTDHGGSSVSFVLGDRVKGGVYGDYPDLTQLNPSGNLPTTVDFRNVLSDLIVSMGGNATTVLGSTYPRLGFI